MSDFLNRPQTALWLGVTPQKFAELRKGELREKGFPEPAFGTRQGERWDLETLQAWRRSLTPEHLRALLQAAPADNDDALAAELDRRAAAMGSTRH